MYCHIYRVGLTLFKAVIIYYILFRCDVRFCVLGRLFLFILFFLLSSISFINNSVFLCFLDRTSMVYCRFKGYGKVGSSQLVSELRFSDYLGVWSGTH